MEASNVELLVLDTLTRATSQNTEVLKPATLKLTEWETEPGYYSILVKIVCNYSIDATVRWLAVTCLKNGVERYWRRFAPNAISEEEKASLRIALMETFREPNPQVTLQLAVLISRIARYDCPRQWPELIPSLLEMSKNEDLDVQLKGVLFLFYVIKALSSRVLPGERKAFHSLAADIFPHIFKLWDDNFESFFLQVEKNDQRCCKTLERAVWSLKILCKLTIYGFKQPHLYPAVSQFVTELFGRAGKMIYLRKTIRKWSETLFKLSEKIIMAFVKLLKSMLDYSPFSFISFMQDSLEFIFMFLFSEQKEEYLFEKFIVQCMNLVRAVISYMKFKLPKHSDAPKNLEAIDVDRIKKEFFKPHVLAVIFRKLITHYFLLTKRDLELWDSDPESFERAISDEVGEYGEVSLPACTYWLFVALFHEYRDSLSPILLELIQKNHHLVDPQDMDSILRKDAVYNAIGLAAFDLYDEIDFDQWFSTTLLQELSIKDPNYRIIRRRVAWLIGQWASVKLSVELRPALYGALIPLLQSDEDMAVRLAAASALKRAVDDFQFYSDQFMEFLEPAFSLLFALLKEVRECDTKLQVLNVLSFIVERMGTSIKPYSQSLIQYLPLLWEESANHNMLRCAIVATLVRFVRGLITENLTSFLCPVIELCTDFDQEAHVYLLEEGLDLWCAFLENSTSLHPQLLHLYRAMPSVLEFTREHLQSCGSIIQAYILLSPQQFLSEYGESVITSCMNLLSDLDEEGIAIIMQVIDTAIRANASLAISVSMPILPEIVLNISSGKYYGPWLMSRFLEIVSRVLIYSREIFTQLMVKTALDKSETSEQFLEKVLSVWLRFMPLVTQKEKKKLLALALSALLTIGSNTVIAQFKLILKNIVEALNDVVDIEDLTSQIDSLMVTEEVTPAEEDEDAELETENDWRRKQLMETDPEYNIELRSFFQSQINDLKSKLGNEHFEGLLWTTEAEVIEQCKYYIRF